MRRFFDLDADLPRITGHLEQDPFLAPAVKAAPGLRIPGCWSRFELAVRAILGQQVTVRGATRLTGRLIEAFGETPPGDTGSGLNRLFPSAKTLAGADVTVIGIPAVRARAISLLSLEVVEGRISMADTPDLEEAVTRLTCIPGIGEWTAHYIAMRAFGEPDAFPAADLGLRRALKTRSRLPSARQLGKRAEHWRPWRAYAVFFLWTQEIRRHEERRESEHA